MDYITQINGFWQANNEHRFTSVEAYLYFYLLDVCNRLFWRNPFSHTNSQLTAALGVTEVTIIGAKRRLEAAGLIKVEAGRYRRTPSKYYIIPYKNYSLSDSLSDSTIIRQDKTKTKTNNVVTHKGVTTTREPSPPNKSEKKNFKPPKLEEVAAYCQERGTGIDAQQFYDYYTANGWVQGKQGKPVVDWKACVRTWERNGYNKKTNQNKRNSNGTDTTSAGWNGTEYERRKENDRKRRLASYAALAAEYRTKAEAEYAARCNGGSVEGDKDLPF